MLLGLKRSYLATILLVHSGRIPSICSGLDLALLPQMSPGGHTGIPCHLDAPVLLWEGKQPSSL